MRADILVVGGGIGGLTAARALGEPFRARYGAPYVVTHPPTTTPTPTGSTAARRHVCF